MPVLLIILLIIFIIVACYGCEKPSESTQLAKAEYEAWISQPDGNVLHLYLTRYTAYASGSITMRTIDGEKYITHINNVLIHALP